MDSKLCVFCAIPKSMKVICNDLGHQQPHRLEQIDRNRVAGSNVEDALDIPVEGEYSVILLEPFAALSSSRMCSFSSEVKSMSATLHHT